MHLKKHLLRYCNGDPNLRQSRQPKTKTPKPEVVEPNGGDEPPIPTAAPMILPVVPSAPIVTEATEIPPDFLAEFYNMKERLEDLELDSFGKKRDKEKKMPNKLHLTGICHGTDVMTEMADILKERFAESQNLSDFFG
jgi:hypothetical protein